MSQVLYDVPGPRAIARHRLYAVVGGLVVLGIVGAAGWKLWSEGAISGNKWSFFEEPQIAEALLEGLLVTIEAAALAIGLAVVFGAVFAVGKLSDHA